MRQPFDAVLFDLGNTLAAYYHAEQFQPILETAIRNVLDELQRRGHETMEFATALAAALAANREAADFRVRPLAERLVRVFNVESTVDQQVIAALSERFLEPIFAIGSRFEDALPVLSHLRAAGFRTGIVSNSPWGSPAALWRVELQRLDLLEAVDVTVFCGDVGWRKPAKIIFDHAAQLLGVRPERCCFVGDDPKWDVEGAAIAGMWPILIDRDQRHPGYAGARVANLWDVVRRLEVEP